MEGVSVVMALVDFLPVVLFFIAAVILQRDLYNKMVKGCYSLLASGSILVLLSGFYKAVWKMLYALEVCDFDALNKSFFPLQAAGWMLFFLALVGMFTKYNKNHLSVMAVAPVVYSSNLIFIIAQTLGAGGAQWVMFAIAKKMKQKMAMVLYVVAFIFMLAMGYLGAKFDHSSSMNWVAQLTNIISWGSFLTATVILHKNGLAEADVLK